MWDFYESYPVVSLCFYFSSFLNGLHKTENCLGCVTIHAQELDLFFTLLDVLAGAI